MEIVNMLVPKSKYSIKCPYEMNPEFIIIHNTANDASAINEVTYMIGNDNKVSFHCAIDDYRIVQGIPFTRNTWNATDGANGEGNRKGISLEICYSKTGGERFKEAERLTAEYVAYLLKQYGWGIDKVKKHDDFYPEKGCPYRTISLGWQRFLNMVKSYMTDKPIDNNIESGSDEPVRIYQNGSTSENVYADSNCTIKIGSLNPREKCDCFGIFNDRAMVRYAVDGTKNYKMGFCKWTGGVK
ncbi:MAG: N-acetylmuramoyl-L-alanine amidase [Clostridia bacterium]|nr:N-acetylmuramoyl-L-alanine amidase [Clostridia bacterium]